MPEAFRFGHFELRPAQRALLLHGEPVKLGGRAFDILLALIERRDRVVSVDELLDIVWPGLAVEENNLSVQISSLRKLLGRKVVSNIPRRGYRFTGALQDTQQQSEVNGKATALAHWRGALLCAQRGSSTAAQTADHAVTDAILRGLEAVVPGKVAGRIVLRSADQLCIAFARAADSARVALRAQQRASVPDALTGGTQAPASLRIGIVAADATPAGLIAGDVDQAQQLAQSAGRNDIIVTADLVGEFVNGVDGEVEDLGDLGGGADAVRIYRVRPLRDWAAPETPTAVASMSGAPRTPTGGGLPSPATPPDHALRPGIAVLPLEALVAGDPDDMLGEALADDIITYLSRSPEFNVVSGLSSRRLKRCGLSAEYMAHCLSAAYLLTGSYRVASGRIQLNVHLQDTRRGTVIRSMHLDASMQDAFAPMMPLGHRVGQDVAQTLFSDAMQQSVLRPLPELESYALLLGAIGLMHRAAPKEFERARAMLDHLAQRHGCRGVAAAWLAKWHVLRVVQGWSPDASADSQLALDQVARSLDEDSRDSLALSIGGLVHAYLRKDLVTADRHYEAAIDANPSEPLAWLFKATLQAYRGRGSDAEAAGEQALRLSPIDPMKYFFDSLAATAALSNASWERSVALSQRSLKANRSHASTWRTLAYALVKLDRMDEARDAVQRLVEIEPGFTVGRFLERFPGRDGPMAAPWADALKAAGLPA